MYTEESAKLLQAKEEEGGDDDIVSPSAMRITCTTFSHLISVGVRGRGKLLFCVSPSSPAF
jgi:hypothetical protein